VRSGSAWSHASRVRELAHAIVPCYVSAREMREIEGPLRQRGGRAVRLLAAGGGGWAREERLSGECYVYRTHVSRTRKRCRVCGTVKLKLQRKVTNALVEARPEAGRDQVSTSPGSEVQSSVTEASADVRELGGANVSTCVVRGGRSLPCPVLVVVSAAKTFCQCLSGICTVCPSNARARLGVWSWVTQCTLRE
jgi:hypothetical protein